MTMSFLCFCSLRIQIAILAVVQGYFAMKKSWVKSWISLQALKQDSMFEHWCIKWGEHLHVCYYAKQTKAKGEKWKDGVATIDIGYERWEPCNAKEVEEAKEREDWEWKKR